MNNSFLDVRKNGHIYAVVGVIVLFIFIAAIGSTFTDKKELVDDNDSKAIVPSEIKNNVEAKELNEEDENNNAQKEENKSSIVKEEVTYEEILSEKVNTDKAVNNTSVEEKN